MSLPAAVPAHPRFLSEAECRDVLDRLTRFATGGGVTAVRIWSSWTGNVRWARNRILSSGDVREDLVHVARHVDGAMAETWIDDVSDRGLLAAALRTERVIRTRPEAPDATFFTRRALEPAPRPEIFSAATYDLDDATRATLAHELIRSAEVAGLLSAGYLEVAGRSIAVLDTTGRARYFAFTQAQYSVTVRDPQGTGSGWAGMDHWDWGKIDAPALSKVALDKCVQSRNPVRLEPGRYTTILEPQATADLVSLLVSLLDRVDNENEQIRNPFYKRPFFSKLGEPVIDARLSIGADPSDPELGFPPFNAWRGDVRDWLHHAVYHPATWIQDGVLVNLAYDRDYAVQLLGRATGLPNSGAFRISVSGPTSTVEEMVASTKRGLLVTRCSGLLLGDAHSGLSTGVTRDGLWLVEDGKISKPVKNLRFTESPLFALNNVELIGVPRRVWHVPQRRYRFEPPPPPEPVIAPALKVRDFSFTALVDAV